MEKEQIKVLLDDLYLDASELELDFIQREFKNIARAVDYFSLIDTTNLQPITWPFPVVSTYLRDDVVDHLLTNEETLKNAAATKDGYVKYVKVV